MPFSYKRVLLIGATSGIGLALAEKIIANGSHVIAVGRRKENLESLVQNHGPEKVSTVQFDITNLEGIPSFVESVIKAHPNLDCAILNSGIQRSLDFSKPDKMDLNLVSAELTTNYTSYIHLLKYLLPHLLSSTSPASLIFVTSALALVPIPRCAGYCASKAALHHLILCIREQLRDSNVKTIEIIPPAVKTELHDKKHQPDLEGGPELGMDLDKFTEEAWRGLEDGKTDIPVGMAAKSYEILEERRQGIFKGLLDMMKGSSKS